MKITGTFKTNPTVSRGTRPRPLCYMPAIASLVLLSNGNEPALHLHEDPSPASSPADARREALLSPSLSEETESKGRQSLRGTTLQIIFYPGCQLYPVQKKKKKRKKRFLPREQRIRRESHRILKGSDITRQRIDGEMVTSQGSTSLAESLIYEEKVLG